MDLSNPFMDIDTIFHMIIQTHNIRNIVVNKHFPQKEICYTVIQINKLGDIWWYVLVLLLK